MDGRDRTFSEVGPVERRDGHPVDSGTPMLVGLQTVASRDDAVDTWAVDKESVAELQLVDNLPLAVGTIAVAKEADSLSVAGASAVDSWAAVEMEAVGSLNTEPEVVVDILAVAGNLDAALEAADRPAVAVEVEDRIVVVERTTERLDRLNAMDCSLVVADTKREEDYMTFVRCEEVIALVDGED